MPVGKTGVNVGVPVGITVAVGVGDGGTKVNVGRGVVVGGMDTTACCCPPKQQAATFRTRTAGIPHRKGMCIMLWLLPDCDRVLELKYGQV